MKKRAPEPESHERWLVSYADFITLMFAFFVVMFAAADVDRRKVEQFSEAYEAYLEGGPKAVKLLRLGDPSPPEGDPSESGDRPMSRAEITAMEMAPVADKMREILDRLLENEDVTMSVEARGLVISLREAALFGAGQAAFRTEAGEMLDVLSNAVSVAPGRQIRLEGHTDDRPIKTEQYPSNWELSSARATNVMRALTMRHGVTEGQVSVAGYGEHRPVASNDTPEGRAQNRRVDIVILADDAAEQEPGGGQGEPPGDDLR